MNNKADVIDELDVAENFPEASPAADAERAASGVDIVDSINRAAFERRTEFPRLGIQSSSKTAGLHR